MVHTQASASFGSDGKLTKKTNKHPRNQNIVENCKNLLDLEKKVLLTEKEIKIGYLIHDLIETVATAPLEYCGEIVAQVKKETVEEPTSIL